MVKDIEGGCKYFYIIFIIINTFSRWLQRWWVYDCSGYKRWQICGCSWWSLFFFWSIHWRGKY